MLSHEQLEAIQRFEWLLEYGSTQQQRVARYHLNRFWRRAQEHWHGDRWMQPPLFDEDELATPTE